ncbi:uncharacterized protein LOC119082466 [Bradysia coprophila]|uniref:uncharacterized protein LOC119082466 n=1 Tax=Bradysia coprophila TaxID=38358 RepID=UPI00187DBB28|nr:uncharacterized protein LOC119082466 [Bradysia coprophila]
MSESDDDEVSNATESKDKYVADWLTQAEDGHPQQDGPSETVQTLDQGEQVLDGSVNDQFTYTMIGGGVTTQAEERTMLNPAVSLFQLPFAHIHTQQSGPIPPPFVLDIVNQQRQKAISSRFAGLTIKSPTTFASNTTHNPAALSQTQTTIAVSNQQRSSASTKTQPLSNKTATTQGNATTKNSQVRKLLPVCTPQTAPIVNSSPAVTVSNPNVTTPNTSHPDQNSPITNVTTSTTVTTNTGTSGHQIPPWSNQCNPTSSHLQPIASHSTSQQFNPNLQPISGLGQSNNLSGQPIVGMNNTSNMFGINVRTIPGPNNIGATNQAPPNNNPQHAPTRLQLASRQTMPKEYPKFNGDPTKWAIFYSTFVNCTNECGLSNAENLGRLVACLEEPAVNAVKNLLTRPEAVPEVIGTLQMLYGRPEASIEAQLDTIRKSPPPKMHLMQTFIDFAMAVRNVSSEIQSSGMWQYLYDPRTLKELTDKLPYHMRLEWGEIMVSMPNVNLSHFSDWLFARAKMACAVTLPTPFDKKTNKTNSDNHVNTHSKDNGSDKKTETNAVKRSKNSNEKVCDVCNKNSHYTIDCRKFLAMALSDRWECVKNKKLCKICLGNHHIQRCESKLLCGESGCTIKHHRLLHNSTKVEVPPKTPAKKDETEANNVHSAHQVNKIVVLRRYIPVVLHGPKGSINVIAFFDDGSDMTLVEHWVAQRLGITGKPEELYLKWTAKIVRKEPNSQSIDFEISGTHNANKRYRITDVRTVKSLSLPPQTVNAEEMKNEFKFLRRLPIESYNNETPKILIGLKDCKLSTPLKIRSGKWEEPIAAKTLLGWEIHGNNSSSAEVTHLNFHNTNDTFGDENLHKLVERFFSIENFGVKAPEQTIEALSDKRARHLLESTTKRIGDKFETGLLWKYDDISLPNSLPMATKRLESLEKRLDKDPDLAIKFRAKFNEYLEKGYVRKLNAKEVEDTDKRTWYLPLFPVTYPKKPSKIRLVWDAAAKVGNISLNSMLLSGPDLLVPLPGVLYRFREKRITVTGDIKEMFHQVNMRIGDQKSQRFLYRDAGSSKIDVYVLQVMSFGAACSPSSAQYVKNRNAREFKEYYPKAEEAIRTNTYVDDWLQSFDTELEAECIAKEVKFVHSQGGFEIRNWLSNSENVSRSLGALTENEQKLSFEMDENQTERILGMWWQVQQDKFTYSLKFNPINKAILTGIRRPTKREALRTLMTIYDPLGFLAAYLVQLKMILQDIWRAKISWDQQIPENDPDQLYTRWSFWIKQLPDIERVNINRHYSDKIVEMNPTKIELHVFVDASELAYATVAFFRIEDKVGVECALIGGKTKVAPLRPLSVPRMELQAAVLGARFKNTIVQNHTLKITRTIFWTDSSTVLSWLRSDLRRYTQYVGARICEVLETTALFEWRWIPSHLNVADDATKFKNSSNLEMNCRWFRGPDFLFQSEEHWPTMGEVSDTNEEIRPKYVNTHTIHEGDKLAIKFERFIQWQRTMAFVCRFVNNIRAKLEKVGFEAQYGRLTSEELQDGEDALIRIAQANEFAAEIEQLLEKKVDAKGRRMTVDKRSSIYRYSPYLDESKILRLRGRIDAISNVSLDQKRPIILPTKNQITELIVNDYHRRYQHQNTETVINEVKQKYVVPRLRVVLKRIRRNCQHCKNIAARPNPPEMAPLPIERLASFTRPYTFVGIDYAGPYKIVQFRRTVKRWIVLYTCLTIRAVYIDVAESLESDSCIMSIRRFIARNGTPSKFFSDRGTTLVGADNELAKEIRKIDHDLLNVTFTTCYTEWHFNPPYGQHMGGTWERLIGSMKVTLDKILPTSHYPNHETFITALAEVENIINSRPLTFVSIEPDDQEALTPNHFLKGSSNGNKPPGIFPPLPTTLRGNWRYAQQIANEFWKKWVKEYLPMITRRTKWFDNVKPIEVGDQVIIVDEDAPRNTWERGVIIEALESSSDGQIRRVNVRTMNGIYTRPVSKLAVLDISESKAKPLTHETLAGGSVAASTADRCETQPN